MNLACSIQGLSAILMEEESQKQPVINEKRGICMKPFFEKGSTVLFYGDSITDVHRDRSDFHSLGEGYPAKTAAIYQALFAENEVKFLNRGISGDTTTQLLERYDADVKALNPDYISILIGINDTWRRYDSDRYTSTEQFEKNYRQLLGQIRRDLPKCKVILMEPWLLSSDPKKEMWHGDFDPKQETVNMLKSEGDYFLPTVRVFDEAKKSGAADVDISADGVHPTDFGHGLITLGWLRNLEII